MSPTMPLDAFDERVRRAERLRDEAQSSRDQAQQAFDLALSRLSSATEQLGVAEAQLLNAKLERAEYVTAREHGG